MKIKYVHCSEPEVEKVYDTVVALKNSPFIHMPQEEFDQMELEHMERDKDAGKILLYEKLLENPVITHNLVIHCDTKTEAKMLMRIAEDQGFIWGACKESAAANTYFDMHQDETCYRFQITDNGKYVSYSDSDFYRQKDFPIVEFDKFFFGISYEEIGYDWEGMYGVSKEMALDMIEYMPVYKLYEDGTEAMADDREDVKSFQGMLGIEKDDFKKYVETLCEREMGEEREER